ADKLFHTKEILEITRLGGLTNKTFKVVLPMGEYVFRLPGEGTEKVINRKEEEVFTRLASRLAIDSPIVYFDPDKGVKVSEYIENAITMSPEQMRKKDHLLLAAQVLHKLHTCGEVFPIVFHPLDMAARYEAFILSHNVPLFDDYSCVKEKIIALEEQIVQTGRTMVPSHNDPLCENWVRGNEQMFLVDWEYAGMNDAFWDIADVSIEADLDPALEQFFLEAYLDGPAGEKEQLRVTINKILIDFLWSLWGKIRVPFDGTPMEEYALMRYLRLQSNLAKLP
ncbi:MAG: phosphotransferase, partial [Clostridiales bacterium]|nr:phosphotransferase [Clostridiales bacterium]